MSYSALALLLLVGTVPVRASTVPIIQGYVSAFEICPQTICGAAIFTGLFVGRVGANPFAVGAISVGAQHEDLPDPDEFADITGGVWVLRLLSGRRFTGVVDSGTIFNNGDDTFALNVQMLLGTDQTQTLTFNGELSHRVFPPTLIGQITQ